MKLKGLLGHVATRVFQAFSRIGSSAIIIFAAFASASPVSGQIVLNEENQVTLNVSGFAQARYTSEQPNGSPSSQTFDLALGRLAIFGSALDPRIGYFFQIETSTFGNNNRVTMLDAWLRYRFSEKAELQAGRMLLPYSRQFYTHPGNLLFSDLSIADYAFNLSRAVGFGASGKTGRLSYHGVVANSVRALDGLGQRNLNPGMAVLGRLEFDVLAPYGYMESLPGALPAKPQLSIGLAAGINPVDEASAFQNTMPGDRTRNMTLDSGFRWNRLTLQAAVYYRRNRLQDRALPVNKDWGTYAQGGVYMIPQRLELAARVSKVDYDRFNTPQVLGGATENTVGMNYYIHGHHLKAQGDYSLTRQLLFSGGFHNDRRVRAQLQLLF
jgi:phosphate-selective porin O/P